MKRAPEEIIRVKVIDPPAVTIDRFRRVNAILDEIHYNYTRSNKETRFVNLCTVIGRCGICGQPLYSTANGRIHADGSKGVGFYACKSHHPRSKGRLTKCGSAWVKRETLDELMIAFCQQKLTDPEFLTTLIQCSLAKSSEIIVPFPDRTRQNAIDALRRREKKNLEMAEADLITVAEARARQVAIHLEIEKVQASMECNVHRPGASLNVVDLVTKVVRGALAFRRQSDRLQMKLTIETMFSEVFFRLREQSIVAFKFSAELLGKLGSGLPTDIINLDTPFSLMRKIPEGEKHCHGCRKTLFLTDFNKSQSRCRDCQKQGRELRKARPLTL